MKINTHELGHTTKMAAMPIYGKNLKKSSFSRTNMTNDLETWYVASCMGVLPKIVKIIDPGLTLTHFTPRSNLVT